MQGRWELTSFTSFGDERDTRDLAKVEIAGDRIDYKYEDRVSTSYRLVLNPAATPKTNVSTGLGGRAGAVFRGIYVVERHRLTFCYGTTEQPPKSLEAGRREGVTEVYRRVKP